MRKQNTEILLPALPSLVTPAITELVTALGIPREFLASDEEIEYAWKDLPRELTRIPAELRGELVGRMCVAVTTGLFDSAVNYIWNAAILRLREKVRTFGLSVVAQILQKDFEESDLVALQDSELLNLALKLNLVDEDGFFFLDQCREIRNNFSAAHPAIGKINDREFITFLNRCTKYALEESSSPTGVDLGAFITAVKVARFSAGQLRIWKQRLLATHNAQRQLLITTVHGIYCDPSSSEPSRLNGLDLCVALKDSFTVALKSELINRHSEYLAKGDERRHAASQQFFEKLGLLSLLNESERHYVFSKAIERLWSAHLGMNNFYTEPSFAERLAELASGAEVPETAQEEYVSVVLCCCVGNSYGVSHAAVPIYHRMIKSFSPREVAMTIKLASTNTSLSIRLNGERRTRFLKAISLIDPETVPTSARPMYEKMMRTKT